MSVSRHHADWLSLVESSGPFLSLPVLLRAFPQGLDPRDPEQAKQLRLAYEEWQENPNLAAKQRAWVMHVLTQVLVHPAELLAEGQTLPPGLTATMAEYSEILRPELALLGPTDSELAGKPQLLISLYPVEQSLDKPVTGKHWKATPGTRMMELLHATDVPLGLVTNGEEWMLVFAPRGDTTGFTSWYASLWIDEPITLRAFHSLLSTRRFFGVAPSDTLLALLKESAQDQQEVTNQLGDQVRDAVEVLIQAFDRLDQDSGRRLLKGLDEKSLYDAALTVMMRLVFLFSAEERGLLRLGEPLYDENYAVSTLREQLQEVADHYGEEVLERRHDGWARLLAIFRAVHGGVNHQDLMLPAYGGSLFNPDRYPFLEGRAQDTRWQSSPAAPLEINNRVVLHLLKSLQMLQVKVPGGGPAEAIRVSFEGLNIEQIGHVYEGLLDHTAVRAKEVVLGLAASRKKPVASIALAELKKLRQDDEAKLIELLEEETGRSGKALEKALKNGGEPEEFHKLLVACAQDKELAESIVPFRGLLRQDSFERLVVVLPGGIYVGQGSARRSTGTHYTPRSLTEPIVQHTMEPLVHQGPAEGLPKEQWRLRSPKEILDLKVCDMAMGSGAFLVQTCRFLSERLVEAWEKLEKEHPGEVLITPEGGLSRGEPSERLVPKEVVERLAIARRLVADRCLYGVDINPMAVEMAKLSIWLITVDKSRPFTFLDHALKCGDSLVGVSSLRQVESFTLRPGERQITFSTANLFRYVEEAAIKRLALEALPSSDPKQIETKHHLYAEAEAAIAKVKALASCLVALELRGADGKSYEDQRIAAADGVELEMEKSLAEFQRYAAEQLNGQKILHWPIEFPEVFAREGFDAFVGNPPFMGGQMITPNYGPVYRSYLVRHLADNKRGSADLCTYFVLRVSTLLRTGGSAGLVTTNTISEGETRSVGLEQLRRQNVIVRRAVSLLPWPGIANLAVSLLWLSKNGWSGSVILDGKSVRAITTALTSADSASEKPLRLARNAGLAFKGSSIQGVGFLLSPAEAKEIIERDSKYRDVLFPYLGGEDVTRTATGSPTRWAINFFNWSLAEAEQYPVCLEIARRKVKPAREEAGRRNTIGARRAEFWWRYDAQAKPLYQAIESLPYVWATAETSKYVAVVQAPPNIVFAHTVVVFANDSYGFFATVASTIHAYWMETHSSSLETRLKYTLADGFETFPLPPGALREAVAGSSYSGSSVLDKVGEAFYVHRTSVMAARQEGITATYNRIHDRREVAADIERLRVLYREMDQAVVAAYGWKDLDLGHDFHATTQGQRFTLSEDARSKILGRLLALNRDRYEQEGRPGLQEKRAKSGHGKRGSGKSKLQDASAQAELL